MSHFRPPRASSPTKSAKSLVAQALLDTPIVPELAALTAEEIDFIDEVIKRAPTTAATFLTVFKAYNDVLQERGLDPQNEVVYYGKLLKLGTLKGKNWAEKWAMVKEQQGYVPGMSKSGGRTTRVTRTKPPPTPSPALAAAKPKSVTTRLVTGLQESQLSDAMTLHSHQDDMDVTGDETGVAQATKSSASVPYGDTPRPIRRFIPPSSALRSNTLGLDTGPSSASSHTHYPSPSAQARRAVLSRLTSQWDAETTDVAEDATQISSTVPPSYGAATREPKQAKYAPSSLLQKPAPPRTAPFASPRSVSPALPPQPPPRRERQNSAINEEDAWNKIKIARDEEAADAFRRDRLVERCYEVWHQGYLWILTTGEQIDDARGKLILRRALQRWHDRMMARRELYLRVTALSNRRCLKLALNLWKVKYKEKKQTNWRDDMRARMKTVRERNEQRVKKDAWAKWRQSYRSHMSEVHFARKLLLRFFERWKNRVRRLDELDAAADHLLYVRGERTLEISWYTWGRAAELRRAEREVRGKVDLRIMTNVIDAWKRRCYEYHHADRFHDKLVLKQAIRSWKTAKDRIRMLERKATKHVARQNDVLVRAVMRVWKAHERGKLFERVKSMRLLKQAWAVWKQRMSEQKEREEMAALFMTRSSSVLTASMLKRWRQVHISHQNAQTFAVHYHSAQVQYQRMLTWRLQLRAKLRMVKQAKVAQKQLVVKRCFRAWAAKHAERQRQRKVKEADMRVAARYFNEWLQRAHRQRVMKLAEQIVQRNVARRILANALAHWTTHVVDIKSRQLETVQKTNHALKLATFMKWKTALKRHVDRMQLMDSHLDVKREEKRRKIFYRWLNAAKQSRHRRAYLQSKEEELKFTVIAAAWDRWRERYQDIRLQPRADAFLVQRQQDLLFRAFLTWRSKSRSVPAVRFHASHAKAHFWKIWRDAMPRALQAREARQKDRRTVLTKAFAKWMQAHKTKLELRAIARARYLRLPTSSTRPIASPAPLPVPSRPISRPIFPARPVRPRSPSPPSEAPAAPPRRGRLGLGLTSLLTTAKSRSPERPRFTAGPSRSPERPPRPKLQPPRDPSPVSTTGIAAWRAEVRPLRSAPPSVVGDGVGRSSLWQELQEVRRKSRSRAGTLTERTRSPEPP